MNLSIVILLSLFMITCNPFLSKEEKFLKAIESGDTEKARTLIPEKSVFFRKDLTVGSFLHRAVKRNDLAMVKLIVENDLPLDILDSDGNPSIILAYHNGFTEIVKYLAGHGAIVHDDKNSVVMCYASKDDLAMVEYLFDSAIDLKSQKKKIDFLFLAIKDGYINVVKLFLKKGFSIHTKEPFYGSILNCAALYGRLEIVKLALQKGAKINEVDDRGFTPIHSAISDKNLAIVKILIEHGADLNLRNEFGNTPLHTAAILGHTEVASLLLEHGADINAQNSDQNTPLHLAVFHEEQSDFVKFLIESGADVNLRNKNNQTACSIAKVNSYQNSVKIIEESPGYVK